MEILRSLTAGGWGLLVGWIFPSIVATLIGAFFFLPALDGRSAPNVFSKQPLTEQIFVIVLTATTLGLVLSALSRLLYRIMEGYLLLPSSVKRRWILKQRTIQEKQWRQYWKENKAGNDLEAGLLLEKCQMYPSIETQVAPTRLGNVIRAFETYGSNRYGLDAVTFWEPLLASAPDPLRKSEERSRAGIDFFISTLYLSVLFGLCSIFTIIYLDPSSLLWGPSWLLSRFYLLSYGIA